MHNRAAQLARERGIVHWVVSLSHTEHYAIASIIGTHAD
jgi:phosphopantetheinyl transferase (holo-ACP synthase)